MLVEETICTRCLLTYTSWITSDTTYHSNPQLFTSSFGLEEINGSFLRWKCLSFTFPNTFTTYTYPNIITRIFNGVIVLRMDLEAFDSNLFFISVSSLALVIGSNICVLMHFSTFVFESKTTSWSNNISNFVSSLKQSAWS